MRRERAGDARAWRPRLGAIQHPGNFLVVAQSLHVGKVHARKLKQLMGDYDQISSPSSQPEKENPLVST